MSGSSIFDQGYLEELYQNQLSKAGGCREEADRRMDTLFSRFWREVLKKENPPGEKEIPKNMMQIVIELRDREGLGRGRHG